MENINIDLENARLICGGKIKLEKELKLDSFTSINTSGYFKYLNLRDKSLLTIGNSSDEVFNGVFYGSKDITLIDDNPYTLYYYYLKLAALYTLSYREFEWFFYKYVFNKHPNNKMFSKRMFKKITPILKELNEDSFYLFNELFEEFDKRVIRDSLFNDNGYHLKALRGFNIYLRNDQTYNKTRMSMQDTKFNYLRGNILIDNIPRKYDAINLSSLCVRKPLHKMTNLYDRLEKENLNIGGLIVLGYLWNKNIYTEDYLNVWKNIYNDPNYNKIFSKYITNVESVNGYQDLLWEENKKGERVLIYQNKDHK